LHPAILSRPSSRAHHKNLFPSTIHQQPKNVRPLQTPPLSPRPSRFPLSLTASPDHAFPPSPLSTSTPPPAQTQFRNHHRAKRAPVQLATADEEGLRGFQADVCVVFGYSEGKGIRGVARGGGEGEVEELFGEVVSCEFLDIKFIE
jgi:hypothetical protein